MNNDCIHYYVLFGVFVLLILIHALLKEKHPIFSTVKNIFGGILTLFIVNIIGTFTSVTIPISLLSLGISAVTGLPGVTLLLALNLI